MLASPWGTEGVGERVLAGLWTGNLGPEFRKGRQEQAGQHPSPRVPPVCIMVTARWPQPHGHSTVQRACPRGPWWQEQGLL